MTTTHQHQGTLSRWNWSTDRIETWCSCGLMLSDDYDEASYGPPHPECGQAWLIDLAYGLAVGGAVFFIILAILLLA